MSFPEGRQILLSNTAYLNAHTQTDIEWKTRGKAKSIEEFTALYASQIQDFTDEEKKVLDAYISIDEARFNYLGIRLPTTHPRHLQDDAGVLPPTIVVEKPRYTEHGLKRAK